jgi:hypothetical protein
VRRPEEKLQRAIVQHLRLRLESPWLFWANTAQRGTRKPWEQAILNAMGQRAGLPDLFVLGPGPTLIGLECKAPPVIGKRGARSKAKPRFNEAQAGMFPKLAGLGVPVIVCRDVDDALAALATRGAPFKGRTR